MKKLLVVLTVVVAMFSNQGIADNAWGPMVSYWDTGDWGDGAGVGIKFSVEMVPSVNLDFSTTWFSELSGTIGAYDTDLEIIPVEVGISALSSAGSVELYAGAGLGFYNVDAEVGHSSGITEGVSLDDEIGYYILAGLVKPLQVDTSGTQTSRVSLFIEGVYRSVSLQDVTVGSDLSFNISEDLGGIGVNAGFMLHW